MAKAKTIQTVSIALLLLLVACGGMPKKGGGPKPRRNAPPPERRADEREREREREEELRRQIEDELLARGLHGVDPRVGEGRPSDFRADPSFRDADGDLTTTGRRGDFTPPDSVDVPEGAETLPGTFDSSISVHGNTISPLRRRLGE